MSLAARPLRDRLILGGSLALAVFMPLAAVFSHRAFAPILLGMAIVVGASRRPWIDAAKAHIPFDLLKNPFATASAAIGAFCLWILVSGLWSPTQGALLKYLGVGGVILAASLVVAEMLSRDARDIKFLATNYIAAVVIGAALFLFEAQTGGYLRFITPPADHSPDRFDDILDLGRGLTALLPGAFPAIAMIVIVAMRSAGARRRALVASAAVLACALFIAALELTIAANSAAVLAGAGAFLIAFAFPRRGMAAMAALYFAALVGAPLMALLPVEALVDKLGAWAPLSWLHRLFIWQNAAASAIDCLPFGCGVDYARALSAEGVRFELAQSPDSLPLLPVHPHNAFLQIWLELGLPGVAFFAIYLLACAFLVRNAALSRPAAAGLAGAGAAIFVVAMVEMSIWQEWRLASIGLAVSGVAIAQRLSAGGARREDGERAL